MYHHDINIISSILVQWHSQTYQTNHSLRMERWARSQ